MGLFREAVVIFLFVEYQLFAQSVIPDNFLALAANCSDNFLYLPLAKHLDQGGYETTSFCWCSGEFEEQLKTAITNLLQPDQTHLS